MKRIIDLTLTIDSMLPGASVRTAKTIETDGWNATTLELYSHCGTHMDAPVHFGVGDQTIDQIPLDRCLGPARVIDLSHVGPRELITVEHLGTHGTQIGPGERLLLRTDWSHRVGQPAYRDQLPRISEQLARWLVERRVGLLGVEPPSVADVNEPIELTTVHRILFEGEVIIVEGLTNLDQITRTQVELIVLPLKIRRGDGCPVRALVIEEIP